MSKPSVIPPRLLTIAGSDSGGGAGIQADLKTFAAHGAYGMSAVTAVTAQDTRRVHAVAEVPPDVVAAQIDAVFEDLGVDGVKIGMLASRPLVETVAARLATHLEAARAAGHAPPPVVLDPVMVAKSGDPLLADDAVEALIGELVPLATVITPNLPEAERMGGLPVGTETERVAAARQLAGRADERRRSRYPALATLARPAVLLKGGHGEGEEVVDLLVVEETLHRYAHPRLTTTSTHGTGCTLSSAVAARCAAGDPLPEAVAGAIDYLAGALAAAYPLGGGHGPVHHLYRLFEDDPSTRSNP